MNDYMFTLFRRNGIAIKMDMNISTAFIADQTILTHKHSIRSTFRTMTDYLLTEEGDSERLRSASTNHQNETEDSFIQTKQTNKV